MARQNKTGLQEVQLICGTNARHTSMEAVDSRAGPQENWDKRNKVVVVVV